MNINFTNSLINLVFTIILFLKIMVVCGVGATAEPSFSKTCNKIKEHMQVNNIPLISEAVAKDREILWIEKNILENYQKYFSFK